MIEIEKLKKVDASFHIQSMDEQVKKITTLCSFDQIQKGGIVLIKNKDYYKKFLNIYGDNEELDNIGFVFQESFYKSENNFSQFKELKHSQFFATVENVDLAMSRFSKLFYDEIRQNENALEDGRKTGTIKIHPTSSIANNVFLGENVDIASNVIIHAGCVILSNSKIDENSILYPNVTIYQNVSIGKNCRIHGNTTIGSDGYSYNYFKDEHLKVWHFGGVTIKDSVEIGSGTSIDQGTFSPTIIGEGTKIDNQVHIAHNCKIGKGVLITGQAGFSGSVTLGDYVSMGGCAQFAPGIVVGDYAQIGGMAGVTNDIPAKTVYAGHPARPIKEWLKSLATLRRFSLKPKKAKQSSELKNEITI